MPPETHALLGASSAKRWLNCPPSARLGEKFPDTGSPYAAAGTLAHAIAELKARKYFLEPMSSREYGARLDRLKQDPAYDKAMDANTDLYLEHLKELAMSYGAAQPFVTLETRVDYSHIAPGGFGTADALIIGGDKLCVVDYKNGAGVPVEAEENDQLKLYALGALRTFYPIFGEAVQTVHLSIVQPNAGGVKEWETTRAALEAWGDTVVRPRAVLAWDGRGDFNPGDWCRFCPAKAQCSARARKLLELESDKAGAPEGGALLPDDKIGDVLTRAMELAAWVEDLKDYALSAVLAGRSIPGFKAVAGRTTREWKGGTDSAFAQLTQRGVEEAMLWERKPVSPAGLEKALGKKLFAETAAELVEKKPGKPALVPASDKRPPYDPAQAAFKPA